MHTDVIVLTNKRRIHAQSNYTNTELKAWFRRFLRHPARKREWAYTTPPDPHGDKTTQGALHGTELVPGHYLCSQLFTLATSVCPGQR